MNNNQSLSTTIQSHNDNSSSSNNNSILSFRDYSNSSNNNNNDVTSYFHHSEISKSCLQRITTININNSDNKNENNINENKNSDSIISFSKIIEYKLQTKDKLKTAEIIKEINDYILSVPNKNIYKFKLTDKIQTKLGKKDDWILNFEKYDKDLFFVQKIKFIL